MRRVWYWNYADEVQKIPLSSQYHLCAILTEHLPLPYKLISEFKMVEIRMAVEICLEVTNFDMQAVAASRIGARLLPTRPRQRTWTMSLLFSPPSLISSVSPNTEPCTACHELAFVPDCMHSRSVLKRRISAVWEMPAMLKRIHLAQSFLISDHESCSQSTQSGTWDSSNRGMSDSSCRKCSLLKDGSDFGSSNDISGANGSLSEINSDMSIYQKIIAQMVVAFRGSVARIRWISNSKT